MKHYNDSTAPKNHTFKLATRSAVSNKVNWLIWSTIPETLRFVDGSVEAHRLDVEGILCCAMQAVDTRVEEEDIRERAQLRTAYWQDNDIVGALRLLWRWISRHEMSFRVEVQLSPFRANNVLAQYGLDGPCSKSSKVYLKIEKKVPSASYRTTVKHFMSNSTKWTKIRQNMGKI